MTVRSWWRALIAPGVLGAVLVALAWGAAPVTPAHAGTIAVDATQVTSRDPNAITFTARVTASSGLREAKLEYKVQNPDGNVGGSGDATFSPGTETDLSFTLETKNPTRYIPVGSDFVYRWRLTDNDGVTAATEEVTYRFLDERYDWQSRTEGAVTVYWYGNDDRNATLALTAARSALEQTGELLRTAVPYPIKVMVWRSEAEGQMAMQSRGATFDAQVLTGGQRVAPDLLFVFEPDVDVIRHETAHIVTHVAGDGPFSSIPAWLDEGTAVYAQSSPGGGYLSGVQFAIQTDQTMRLRSLQSPANDPGLVNVFYGQSWSTVSFIIERYGEEQFAEIFRLVREGSRVDDALVAAIGVDQDGLYNAWREANGLAARDFGPTSSGTTVPGAVATRAPLSIPTGSSGSSSSGAGATTAATATAAPASGDATVAGESGTTGAAMAVGGLTVLFAVLLGAGGVYLLRRRG
ncbi:MAG: peptidase MA family metallohydrolase [Dehalococcoidia bacterium]